MVLVPPSFPTSEDISKFGDRGRYWGGRCCYFLLCNFLRKFITILFDFLINRSIYQVQSIGDHRPEAVHPIVLDFISENFCPFTMGVQVDEVHYVDFNISETMVPFSIEVFTHICAKPDMSYVPKMGNKSVHESPFCLSHILLTTVFA